MSSSSTCTAHLPRTRTTRRSPLPISCIPTTPVTPSWQTPGTPSLVRSCTDFPAPRIAKPPSLQALHEIPNHLTADRWPAVGRVVVSAIAVLAPAHGRGRTTALVVDAFGDLHGRHRIALGADVGMHVAEKRHGGAGAL